MLGELEDVPQAAGKQREPDKVEKLTKCLGEL